MGNPAGRVRIRGLTEGVLFVSAISLLVLSAAGAGAQFHRPGGEGHGELAEVERLIDSLGSGPVDQGAVKALGARLDRLALLHPLSQRVPLLTHRLARTAGDNAGAALAFNRVIAARPMDPSVYYTRGVWLVEQGRIGSALTDFQKSLDLGREELIHIFTLCFRIFGGHFASFEWIIPDDGPTMEVVARLLADNGLLDESLRLYNKCIEEQPRRADLYHLVALGWFRQGAYEASLAAAGQALALEPSSPVYLQHQGDCLLALGRLEAALERGRRLVAGDPLDARGYLLLARCHTAAGNERLVLQAYREGLKHTGKKAQFHRLIGDIHLAAHRPGEAEPEYRAALAAHPPVKEKQRALYGLGICLEQGGRSEEAAEVLRQALHAGEGMLPWLDHNVSKALERIETT